MTNIDDASLAVQARLIVALTARAWDVAPLSTREVARRAPHGYVPRPAIRRRQAAAALSYALRPAIAYSW
ncbi:MAG: hypothetical protein EOP82_04090 [Variovorax sp.]|nr:MAG: hypothetical protein EOP82_04090 [Variovorax sp.]